MTFGNITIVDTITTSETEEGYSVACFPKDKFLKIEKALSVFFKPDKPMEFLLDSVTLGRNLDVVLKPPYNDVMVSASQSWDKVVVSIDYQIRIDELSEMKEETK